MSEPTELIPSIIAAAIAAAGPKGSNDGAWKAKINEAIPHVASMLGEHSRQWRIAAEVLGASVFTATYVDHAVEESSTRVLVHLDTGKPTKNYPDGIEPIRTHRTDNAQGRSMKERLDRLSAGDEVVVWKALESMGDGADANKVRVLVHFETRPKRDRPAGGATPGGTERPAGDDVALSPSSPPPPPLTDAIDSDRLHAWREGAIARLGMDGTTVLRAELKTRGYDFDGVSEIEWDEIVRPIIRDLIASIDNQKEQNR
jgi:hypothetical protein